MSKQLLNTKLEMLNEFEKEIKDINTEYTNKRINQKRCLYLLSRMKLAWGSSRIDLKNYGGSSNTIEVLSDVSDLNMDFPGWFKDNFGIGCKIESQTNYNLKFKCVNDGTLKITLRGFDLRNIKNNLIRNPVYVNYTNVTVNDKPCFDKDKLLWHNDIFMYTLKCNDGDLINLHLAFETIFDFFPSLRAFLDKKQDDLIKFFEDILNIINIERIKMYMDNFDEYDYDLFSFINDNEVVTDEKSSVFNDYGSFLNICYNYKLNSKLIELENKYDSIIEEQNNYLDSNNDLFNSLFLDYELKPKRLLGNIQTLTLELLNFVNNICKKYNIQWWLDYGNLLGAIRHGGFVPWDDDMDIGMMREDYHKFIDVLFDEVKNHGLDDHIFISYRERYREDFRINSTLQLFIRNKSGRNQILAAVDVFPYDYLKKYEKKNFGYAYNSAGSHFYKKLCEGSDLDKVYMGLDYEEVTGSYFDELNLSYKKQDYIIPGVEGAFAYGRNLYELMVLETRRVFPLTEVSFESNTYPAPRDCHYYLSNMYGEYMNIPKSIRIHGRIDKFRNDRNINEVLEDYISKFKEVNGNY